MELNKGKEISVPPKRNNFSFFIALLALIISLLALVQMVLLHQEQMQQNNKGRLLTAQAIESVDTNRANIAALSQTISALEEKIKDQDTTLMTLTQSPDKTRRMMVLTSASQLVQLAYYQLMFKQDVSTALLALETANKKMASLNDGNLMGARQLLSGNITALQSVPQLDLQALLTQLNSLQDEIKQLPLLIPINQIKTDETHQATVPTWRTMLQNNWERFSKLIVIRRLDKPIMPMLSSEEQIYLDQNLQLLLQQAQWAVLQKQSSVYQASLKQAKNLIQRYFDPHAQSTQATLKTMDGLLSIDVQPTIPDISSTVQAFQRLTQVG